MMPTARMRLEACELRHPRAQGFSRIVGTRSPHALHQVTPGERLFAFVLKGETGRCEYLGQDSFEQYTQRLSVAALGVMGIASRAPRLKYGIAVLRALVWHPWPCTRNRLRRPAPGGVQQPAGQAVGSAGQGRDSHASAHHHAGIVRHVVRAVRCLGRCCLVLAGAQA